MPPLSTLIIGSVNTVIRLFGSNAIFYLSDSLNPISVQQPSFFSDTTVSLLGLFRADGL